MITVVISISCVNMILNNSPFKRIISVINVICGTATETVNHCIQEHPTKDICVLKPVYMENRTRYTSIHFQINSADIDCGVNDVDVKVPDMAFLIPDQNLLGSPKYYPIWSSFFKRPCKFD